MSSNVSTMDLFRNDDDFIQPHRYSAESLIHHSYVSNRVVIEQPAKVKEKSKVVSVEEAYYHLYKYKFLGIVIDGHREVGNNLYEVTLRILKSRCLRDSQLLNIVCDEVPSAFSKIYGGGRIMSRVSGSVGLRTDASLKELWAILSVLTKYCQHPEKVVFYVKK